MRLTMRVFLGLLALLTLVSPLRAGDEIYTQPTTVQITVTPKDKAISPTTTVTGAVLLHDAPTLPLDLWDGRHWNVTVTAYDTPDGTLIELTDRGTLVQASGTTPAAPVRIFFASFPWQPGQTFKVFENTDCTVEAKITPEAGKK